MRVREAADARLKAIYAAIQDAREVAYRRGSDSSQKMLDECETLLRETYSSRSERLKSPDAPVA